jgi:hypothetical protein
MTGLKADGEAERTAIADCTLDPEVAPHQLD